ncbi:MAG: GerMN domain-containing protein [bacterium]|nr:GerMN domain-containing protein [bacterium]
MARSRAGCGVWLLLWIIIFLIILIIILQNPAILNKKNLNKMKSYISRLQVTRTNEQATRKKENVSKVRVPARETGKKVRPASAPLTVDLFFTRYVESLDKLKLVKVTRTIPGSDSPLFDTINQLLLGPDTREEKTGITSLFPARVRLLNAEMKGPVAYLDFSQEFESGVGVSMLQARLYQIVYTATQFPNVKGVKILINHREKSFFSSENISIRSPLKRIGAEPVF